MRTFSLCQTSNKVEIYLAEKKKGSCVREPQAQKLLGGDLENLCPNSFLSWDIISLKPQETRVEWYLPNVSLHSMQRQCKHSMYQEFRLKRANNLWSEAMKPCFFQLLKSGYLGVWTQDSPKAKTHRSVLAFVRLLNSSGNSFTFHFLPFAKCLGPWKNSMKLKIETSSKLLLKSVLAKFYLSYIILLPLIMTKKEPLDK